nr:hypothetical protein [Tanacetum cinerariifolium]
FELTEREQKINEQLRIVITDRNFKEETLKKELHSVKLQLASTINHNKLMVEEVTSLKKNFKEKENKYLEDFLDKKSLKEKVKIGPHDYSKENFLATFTPQKQLTPGQIFWSQDLIKIKSEALKEQTTASRPIKALTVGFEQTKECYLKEVIPFFKTLKEHFKGIQNALTKEIKEMKDIFEELEAEVAQNVVDRKHDEIKRTNLLITNDNLIAECLSKEVFSIATNSELNVARFTEIHVANTIVEARCLELEAELSNLHDKSHNNNHDELVNCFSNLEDNVIKKLQKQISHLQETRSEADRTFDFMALDSQMNQLTAKVTALQAQNDLFRGENGKIKQHYKELYNSIKIMRAKHIEHDHVKPKVLSPGKYAIGVEPIVPHLRNNREAHLDYLKHLKESVETIREIVEEAKVVRPLDSSIVYACRYTKHSQELLEYAIGTCPKDSHQRDKKLAPAHLIRKKKVTFAEQCDMSHSNTHKHVAKWHTQKTNVPVPHSTRVNHYTDASGSQPRSNTKKNRISPAKGVNKKQLQEQPRTNKSSLRTTNHVGSSSRSKSTVINSNLDSVFQTCNKCLIFANHDMCMVDYLQSVVTPPLFVIIIMLYAKLSKFGNLSKLGKYGNPQEKYLPVLVINGDPQAGYSP